MPLESLSEGGEAPAARPLTSQNVKKGDRVQIKGGNIKGKVTDVTQRTVRVEFDNGTKQSFEKRSIDKKLEREGASKPESKPGKFRKGDKIRNKNTGKLDTVVCAPGEPEYDNALYSSPEIGIVTQRNRWDFAEDWEKVGEEVNETQETQGNGHIVTGKQIGRAHV